jgi:citrate synthase
VQITSRTLDEIGRRVTPLATVRLGVSVLLCLCHARAERPGGLGDPVEEARALMSWMAALAAVRGGPARVERALAAQTVAERLDAAFATAGRSEDSTRRIALIDRALVLSAAGDFDVPALVARATATAGGDLCACVIAGLDALSGSKPVEACERLEDVLATLDDAWAARRLPRLWNERGRSIPGFGEAPEPGGDPVVQELLTAARSSTPWSRRLDTLLALIDATAERGMGAPTPAVGIVALSAALDLPPGAAALITALGRTAGLIAHVLAEWAE